jgi:hypothetical protein
MSAGIKTIYIVRNYVPQSTRIILLHALVLSHFNYSCHLFTSINAALLDSIEKQLNWALKACYFKKKFDSASELKRKSKILPIKMQITFNIIVYFWKLKNGFLRAFQSLNFPNFEITTNKRTKKCSLKRAAKSSFLSNSFIFTAIKAWNEIPSEMQLLLRPKKFKLDLRLLQLLKFNDLPRDRIINGNWDGFRIDY